MCPHRLPRPPPRRYRSSSSAVPILWKLATSRASIGQAGTSVRAHVIRERLVADRSLTLEEIAKSQGVVPSYATRLFRLALLAPDIVSAILSGTQPPELTARRLMDDTRLPLTWPEQRQQL